MPNGPKVPPKSKKAKAKQRAIVAAARKQRGPRTARTSNAGRASRGLQGRVAQEKFIPRFKTKRANAYLQTLVYPEKYSGVRYPDSYNRKTGMVKLLIQQNLFYFPVGSIVEAPGTFYYVWRPTLIHPLWVYGPFNANNGQPQWVLNYQTDRFGLFGLTQGTLDPSEQDNQMILNNSTDYNVCAPQTYPGLDEINDPYVVTDTAGNNYFGYTYAAGTGTNTITATITTSGPSTIGDTITITITNGTVGSNKTIVITSTATNQTFWTGNNATIAALLVNDGVTNQLGLCAGRSAPIGFRITYHSVTNNQIGLLSLSLISGASAGPAMQLGMSPVDFPDLATFLAKWTVYRPVSSSCWLAYEGSDLNDGGQVAGVMYRGGEHPNKSNLYNYALLSEEPDGHEDKMKKGMYQFYLPQSTKDTEMRKVINSEEWTHPFMCGAGIVSTPSQVNALRIRAVANFEFVSASQIWEYYPTRPNQGMIDEAVRILHGAKCSMANDNHLQEIANWIKQAAKDVGTFVVDNASWIMPLAGAAATML